MKQLAKSALFHIDFIFDLIAEAEAFESSLYGKYMYNAIIYIETL